MNKYGESALFYFGFKLRSFLVNTSLAVRIDRIFLISREELEEIREKISVL